MGLPFEVIFKSFTACLTWLKQVSREHFLEKAEKKIQLQQISDMGPESDTRNLLWCQKSPRSVSEELMGTVCTLSPGLRPCPACSSLATEQLLGCPRLVWDAQGSSTFPVQAGIELQCLTTLPMKKFLLVPILTLPCCSRSFPLIPSLVRRATPLF